MVPVALNVADVGALGRVSQLPGGAGSAQTTTGGVVGVGRYNPGIGRPLRLAGRRLNAAGIHRQLGDTP